MLGYEDDGHLGATAFMKTRAYDHRFHLIYTNASPSSERRGEEDMVAAINTLIVDRKDQHIYGDESMSAIGKALASEYEWSYATHTGSAFQKPILDQVNCEISDFVHYELTEGSRWCPPSWGSGGTHVMGVNRSYSEGSIMPKRRDIKTISYQD